MTDDEAGHFEKGRWIPITGDIAYIICNLSPLAISAEMYREYRKKQMEEIKEIKPK